MGRFRTNQSGFPDFIAYKWESPLYYELIKGADTPIGHAQIIFVEGKVNGYLSKEEKEKASWYLENNFCSKFLIAKKIKVGRKIEVEYNEFK